MEVCTHLTIMKDISNRPHHSSPVVRLALLLAARILQILHLRGRSGTRAEVRQCGLRVEAWRKDMSVGGVSGTFGVAISISPDYTSVPELKPEHALATVRLGARRLGSTR